jgi:hypothetical protein
MIQAKCQVNQDLSYACQEIAKDSLPAVELRFKKFTGIVTPSVTRQENSMLARGARANGGKTYTLSKIQQGKNQKTNAQIQPS